MRSISPLLGIVGLILAAILLTAVVSSRHPNRGALPPADQARVDEEKEQEEARKQQAAGKTTPPNAKTTPPAAADAPPADTTPMTFEQVKAGAQKATLEVEGRGKIVMELYPKAAPQTVAHFLDLCSRHFYEGIKFHRLEPGFVVQGGDPESKDASVEEFDAKSIGSHDSGKTVPLEAHLLHKKYSIGLARSQSPNSGDCQFYFNLNDNPALDHQYCVFGMVVEGQDVVDKIQKGDVIKSLTAQ